MSCENPNCLTCKLARENPEETDVILLASLAEVLRYAAACMAIAEQNVRSALIVGAHGEDLSPSERDESAQLAYNAIIDAEWSKDLEQIAKPLQVIFEVALVHLPSSFLERAKSLYFSWITEQGGKMQIDAEVAQRVADRFIEQMLSGGRQSLYGDRSAPPKVSSFH